MDVFDLVAKIQLDVSEYEKGLKDAGQKTSEFGNKSNSGWARAGKVAGAAIAAATTAVVGFATESVKTGMTFDSAMAQVAATMGKSVEDIQNLRDFAQEMGSTTAFSATQAAEALNYMALAGYKDKQSMQMLPNVLNLAAAGNINLARASDMVTDAQSALNLSMDETNTMVDQMARASSRTNTSVEQLGDAILTIGATARGVHGGTAELATVLGVLADNGIKGSEGGTHLRNAILSLQTPTKDGVEALKKLNMTYKDMYDSAGNLRSLPEIFLQMQNAMQGMTQQSKDAIISGVFNKTDLAAVNALIGTTSERWDEVSTAIKNSKGAAEQMAATQIDNLQGDITLFKSALEGAQIAISDGLTPELRKFVKFGSKGLAKITEGFKEGGVSGAMEAFGTVLSDGLEMIIDNLPTFVNAGMDMLMALVEGIIENLPMIAESATQIILSLATSLSEKLPDLLPAIVETVMAIVDGLISNVDLLIDAAIAIIFALADGLIASQDTLLEKAPELILKLVDAIIRNAPKLILAAAQLILKLVEGIVQGFGTLLTSGADIVNEIKKGFAGQVEAAKSWGKDLIDNFVEGILSAWRSLKETVANVAQTVRNFLGFSEPKEGPLSNFHTYAPDMMQLFAEGIRDNESMLKRTISDAFDFGDVTVNSARNVQELPAGKGNAEPITIIVQSVLDGKVIGETAYKYQRNMARAYG